MVSNCLAFSYIMLLYFANQSESLRLCQFFNIIAMLWLILWKFIEVIASCICKTPNKMFKCCICGYATTIFVLTSLTLLSVIAFFRIGEMDFKSMKYHTGPYGVGVERMWTKKLENHVLVFYPIDHDEWVKGFQHHSEFLPYLFYGNKVTITALTQIFLWMDWASTSKEGDKFVRDENPSLIHYLDDTQIQTVHEAKLDFKSKEELEKAIELTPMIFSHGWTAQSALYSGHV